jgi:hypothetical protein
VVRNGFLYCVHALFETVKLLAIRAGLPRAKPYLYGN